MQNTGTYGFDVTLYRMPAEKIVGMYIKLIRIRPYTKSIISLILNYYISIHKTYIILPRQRQSLYRPIITNFLPVMSILPKSNFEALT